MAAQSQGLSSWEVAAADAGTRLDMYLVQRESGLSRAKVQKLVGLGEVLLNGVKAKASELVKAGDKIQVSWPPAPLSQLLPVSMPLEILFEDEHLIVLNKPAGISVHPGAGTRAEPTLVQGLLAHVGDSGRLGHPPLWQGKVDLKAWVRPGIVHRLDKDTSGVLVCAKTDRAHAALATQFHKKESLDREYLAILRGTLETRELLVESYLYRDPHDRLRFASLPLPEMAVLREQVRLGQKSATRQGGGRVQTYRYAKSLFKQVEVYEGGLSLASIKLFTGRTHQIRVHALALRCAVLGDKTYQQQSLKALVALPAAMREHVAGVGRQMLHARRLSFKHPESGAQCSFEAPLPFDFAEILAMLGPLKRSQQSI